MPWKGHHRHVFLFRNHLVVCKPKRDSHTDTFSYVFRNMMKVCRCRRSLGGQEEASEGPLITSWTVILPPPHPHS